MDIKQSTDMPELLRELGIRYDPDRLAQVLKSRGGEVRARAIQVTATLGAFIARILKVQSHHATACIALGFRPSSPLLPPVPMHCLLTVAPVHATCTTPALAPSQPVFDLLAALFPASACLP